MWQQLTFQVFPIKKWPLCKSTATLTAWGAAPLVFLSPCRTDCCEAALNLAASKTLWWDLQGRVTDCCLNIAQTLLVLICRGCLLISWLRLCRNCVDHLTWSIIIFFYFCFFFFFLLVYSETDDKNADQDLSVCHFQFNHINLEVT